MTNEEACDYVITLLKHFPHKLSEWEDNFVRSIQLRLEQGRTLTEKQATVLDSIMERCARGY